MLYTNVNLRGVINIDVEAKVRKLLQEKTGKYRWATGSNIN